MRKLFLPFLLFSFVQISAQPYQITFTGSGLSSTVDSVEVLNLTQGTTLTLAGADILEASYLANYAGGLVCEEVGIVPINKDRLFETVLKENR